MLRHVLNIKQMASLRVSDDSGPGESKDFQIDRGRGTLK